MCVSSTASTSSGSTPEAARLTASCPPVAAIALPQPVSTSASLPPAWIRKVFTAVRRGTGRKASRSSRAASSGAMFWSTAMDPSR